MKYSYILIGKKIMPKDVVAQYDWQNIAVRVMKKVSLMSQQLHFFVSFESMKQILSNPAIRCTLVLYDK